MNIEIKEEDLEKSLNPEQARNLIKAIDAWQGCCHFTCGLVKMLLSDLECDMTKEEIAEELGYTYVGTVDRE